MSQQAQLAIKAERMRNTQGRLMARRFALNHGVLRLYTLACQLAAIEP